MNIQELIEALKLATEDNIQKLYEFAYPIKNVRQRFYDLSENIIEHVVKIILYKQQYPTTINHWASEILANLAHCMQKQIKRKGNPYPTAKEIYDWLLIGFDNPDTMTGLRYSLQTQYENPIDIDNEQLYKQVCDFIKYVSVPLSQFKLTKDMIIEYFG